MYVFGFSDSKDVVPVWMDVDEVVIRQIDPWRLDLFDANPVVASVDGQPLSFMRLADVTFAYEKAGEVAVIGMRDGGRTVLIEGKIDGHLTVRDEAGGDPVLVMKDYRVLPVAQFAAHFRQYLHRIYTSKESLPGWIASPASSLWVKAGQVELRSSGYYPDARVMAYRLRCRFAGRMFAPLQVKPAWSEPVRRVLHALEEWNPVVYGRALRDTVCGAIPARVAISMGSIADENVTDRLREAGISVPDFRLGTGSFEMDGVQFHISSPVAPETALLSLGQVVLERPHTVVATRIGLFDLSRSQQRSVSPSEPLLNPSDISFEHVREMEGLESADLPLLPDAFSGCHPVPGCHTEPILPYFAEAFRYATSLNWGALVPGMSPHLICDLSFLSFSDPRHSRPSAEFLSGNDKEQQGFSPDEMALLIREAAQETRAETGCLTAAIFFRFLARRIEDYKHLPRRVQERWIAWLGTWLEGKYRLALTKRTVIGALASNYEKLVVELVWKYVDAVERGVQSDGRPVDSELERFVWEVEQSARPSNSGPSPLRRALVALRTSYIGADVRPKLGVDGLRQKLPEVTSGVEKMVCGPLAMKYLLMGSLEGDEGSMEKSFGELERILLAGGYCRYCCLLLLDEVRSQLDASGQGK